MSKTDDPNNDFDDSVGYIAMVNDDGTNKKGCGSLITALIAILLILCLLSQCLGA